MSSKSTLTEMEFLKALRQLHLPEGPDTDSALGYGKLGRMYKPLFILLPIPTTAAASSTTKS